MKQEARFGLYLPGGHQWEWEEQRLERTPRASVQASRLRPAVNCPRCWR